MRLHLEGTEILYLPRERVFQLLTDADFLVKSLPNARETKVMEDNTIEAKIRFGISSLTTTMAATMKLADFSHAHHARLILEGAGSGSRMKITSDFNLEGENPTRMKWVSNAEISGVMAGINSSMIKGFARKKVREIFQDLKKTMEQTALAS
jgi:carbon monoxide dehydrogenase subunit G